MAIYKMSEKTRQEVMEKWEKRLQLNPKNERPGLATEERAEKLLKLFESFAGELGIGRGDGDIRPFVEQPGLDRTELAIVALITYAAGAITGGRLREELREAFVRKPEEWQGMLDLALGLSLIESQGK